MVFYDIYTVLQLIQVFVYFFFSSNETKDLILDVLRLSLRLLVECFGWILRFLLKMISVLLLPKDFRITVQNYFLDIEKFSSPPLIMNNGCISHCFMSLEMSITTVIN